MLPLGMNLDKLHEVRAQVGQAHFTRARQRLRQEWPLLSGSGQTLRQRRQTPANTSPAVRSTADSLTVETTPSGAEPWVGATLRALGVPAHLDPASAWHPHLWRALDPASSVDHVASCVRCQPLESRKLGRCYQLGVNLFHPTRTSTDRSGTDFGATQCTDWVEGLADRFGGGGSLPTHLEGSSV